MLSLSCILLRCDVTLMVFNSYLHLGRLHLTELAYWMRVVESEVRFNQVLHYLKQFC